MPTPPALSIADAIQIVRQNGDSLLALTTLEVLLDLLIKINALDEDEHKVLAIEDLVQMLGPEQPPARLN